MEAEMAFREKTAWISVLITLAIYGSYFATLASAFRSGDGSEFFGLLIETMIAFVVAFVVMSVAAAILAPKDANAPADERDRLIGLKSERVAYYAVSAGAVTGMWFAFFGWSGFWIANVLFLALALAELAKETTRIVLYRVGV
jgi:hypothetical protein